MDRTKFASLLLLAAVLATMSIAGFLTFNSANQNPQTVEEALSMPPTPLNQRLYAAADEIDYAVELNSPNVRYVTYKDRSTEDVLFMPGSKTAMISSQRFYAVLPGESGRRPHIARVYGAGNVVINEKVQQVNGRLIKTTVILPTAARLITDFADDGITHLHEQEWLKPACCSDEDLLRDERWRNDAAHSLEYRNIFHVDDGTRIITVYDDHMNVLRVMEWPKWESINGAKMRVYYPDTLKLRLDSSADSYTDTVKYYRPDGTLEAIVGISSSTTLIQYFDATGMFERLEQMWYRTDVKKNGVVNSTYRLSSVTEFDGHGNKTRDQSFNPEGVPDREELFNVTIDGVHYVEVDYDYDKDRTLKTVRFWRDEVKFPPYKVEDHTPAEGLTIGALNPASLRLQIQIDNDLPIPPQQMGGH